MFIIYILNKKYYWKVIDKIKKSHNNSYLLWPYFNYQNSNYLLSINPTHSKMYGSELEPTPETIFTSDLRYTVGKVPIEELSDRVGEEEIV